MMITQIIIQIIIQITIQIPNHPTLRTAWQGALQRDQVALEVELQPLRVRHAALQNEFDTNYFHKLFSQIIFTTYFTQIISNKLFSQI